MTDQDELLALAKEVHASKALEYKGRIETLRINFYVFNRNYQELKKLIDVKDNPKIIFELWDLQNRDQLDMVINEILRLLHNYLASAKSLVEQTRVVIHSWYKETNFLNEYKSQVVSRFKNNTMVGFVEELRNFNLHYSIPITHATFSVQRNEKTGQDTIDHSFVLIKSSLLNWSGWTKKGKPFLRDSDEQIDIGNLVDQYYKQIFDFHFWLINRLQEIHKEDLLWLEEMRQKTINAMSEEERKARGLEGLEANKNANSQS